MSSESIWEVVSPLGEEPKAAGGGRKIKLSPSLDTLEGKKIGLFWQIFTNGNILLECFEELLQKRYPTATFVKSGPGRKAAWGGHPDRSIGEVGQELKLDAAIVAAGCCGGCSPANARGTAWLEEAGIPTVGIVCTGFTTAFRLAGKAEGAASLRMVEYPPPNMAMQRRPEIMQYAERLVDQLIGHLTNPIAEGDSVATLVNERPTDIVFKGTYNEVQEYFLRNVWTDGLPVNPPTVAAVTEFLRYTDRKPDDVVATLRPKLHNATVWKVAVNGVLAGCRPEYMPVLLAITEAIAEPRFGIEFVGSTGGWTPVVIVNGPIAKQLGFHSGRGLTRPEHQANVSVSRFLRLLLVNVAGFRTDESDLATFGRTYFPALAESEELSPWPPLNVDRGFSADTNLVTVQSANSMSVSFLLDGDIESQVEQLAMETVRELGGSTLHAMQQPGLHMSPILVMTPLIANGLAKAGYTKDTLRTYIFEHALIPAKDFDSRLDRHEKGKSLKRMVNDGRLSKRFWESDDPERMVPIFHNDRELQIIVCGDPNRNRCFVASQGGDHGGDVSKEVKLPAAWNHLMDSRLPMAAE